MVRGHGSDRDGFQPHATCNFAFATVEQLRGFCHKQMLRKRKGASKRLPKLEHPTRRKKKQFLPTAGSAVEQTDRWQVLAKAIVCFLQANKSMQLWKAQRGWNYEEGQ